MPEESRQLNLRLAANDRSRLAALALLRDVTPTELARQAVLEYLAQHSKEAGLAKVLAGKAEHAAAVDRKATGTKSRTRKRSR